MTAADDLTRGVDQWANQFMASWADQVRAEVARDAARPGVIFKEPSGETARSITIDRSNLSGPVKTVDLKATSPGAFFTNLGERMLILPKGRANGGANALRWIASNGSPAFSKGHVVDMTRYRDWFQRNIARVARDAARRA